MSVIRGEAKIYYKRSSNLWAFTINLGHKPNGKPDRKEYTSTSKNDLIQKRRKIIREIEDGTYRPGSKPTTIAWWNHWIEHIARPRVRPRTLANYISYGRKHIGPHLGARRINELTTDDVRFLHTAMQASDSSTRTIQAVHNTLSRCLKDAVREKVIADNPCELMDQPKATMRDRGAFSVAEAKAIFATARKDGPRSLSRALMALMLGARQAECVGLEWSRVDFDRAEMDLSWQLQQLPWAHGEKCGCNDGVSPARCPRRTHDSPEGFEVRPCRGGLWFTRPKTSASIRMTPMPPALVTVMREWREVWPPNEYDLVWGDGPRPLLARDDRAWWKDLCKRAGVRPLDLHSARHTMVSLLLDAGVSPEVIRQIAGHSTILSTRNYMHVSTDQARKALGALNWGDTPAHS